tara:strand:- start:3330 stop:3833 length:504 start_codon:yes stop_codon:yes gene_type:complete
MIIGAAFPSKYLKAADLQGREVLLTINGIRIEDVDGKGDNKPVLYFNERLDGPGLVLNITNANTIAASLGDETDNWSGQQLVLYPATTDFAGKIVPCIRVRQPQANPATVAPAAAPARPIGMDPQAPIPPVVAAPAPQPFPGPAAPSSVPADPNAFEPDQDIPFGAA